MSYGKCWRGHYGLYVSPGNIKLQHTPSVSLLPGATCIPNAPCRGECYARDMMKRYPSLCNSWEQNTRLWMEDPESFMYDLKMFMVYTMLGQYLRFNVGGDIPSQDFVDRLNNLLKDDRLSSRKLLFYTKKHYLDFNNVPDNFSIVLSMWNGFGNTEKNLPRAWFYDPKNPDPRIPWDNAIVCTDKCFDCGYKCWHLKELGKDVVFPKH